MSDPCVGCYETDVGVCKTCGSYYDYGRLKCDLERCVMDEPGIRIDNKAIRFTYKNGGTNCFWNDLKPRWITRGHKRPYWGALKFYRQLKKALPKTLEYMRQERKEGEDG